MKIEEVKALKVGDMVRYHDHLGGTETIEIVISEWRKQESQGRQGYNVTLQTVAIMSKGDADEWDESPYVGEEGWITEFNHGCFERIA